ncbi:MAG: hypothetical protein LBM70_07415 [Victivallales bacterium]|nr:hypothetical protein [Victivallales bacterium]
MSIIRGKKVRHSERGQAVLEYVILIVVVALAALFVLANFSDRLRSMVTGVTVTLGGQEDDSASKSSLEIVQDLDKTGADYGTNN